MSTGKSNLKVGDVIVRRGMERAGRYRITGESPDWDAWEVQRIAAVPGTLKAGLVFKNDDRWKKVVNAK